MIQPLVGRGLWWSAITNLVVNICIVVTGGAVRLTGSGLGCPTWPQCTDTSYVPHAELGIHGAIEFGNRMLTFVLVVVAVVCWGFALAAMRRTHWGGRTAFWLSTGIALGIPAQAVIGGITVRTHLNPWVVACHLLVSMVMVGLCVWLIDDLRGPTRPAASMQSRRLAWLVLTVGAIALWLGTVVTGSGPHAGDADAPRTGLDPEALSTVHALSVWVLIAVTVGLAVTTRRKSEQILARFALVLLGVELAQGLIGYVQYFTNLPEALVATHMLGAALVAAGLARVVLTVFARNQAEASTPF